MEILSIPAGAIGLTIGSLYFWVIGTAAQRALRLRFGGLDFFHRLAVGQVVFIVYFYLRSCLAHWVLNKTGKILAISILEPLAVALLLILFFILWRVHYTKVLSGLKLVLKKNRYGILCILAIAILIALRELPREVAISTDSAQYTFWTKQVSAFGVVPYTQFAWGELHFDYPAGFAVLNHAWSAVSGVNAASITAIQTVLQAQLTWLLLAEFALRIMNMSSTGVWKTWFGFRIFALGLLVYYLLVPVGYEKTNYMNLGAGRASSLLMLSLFVVLIEKFRSSGMQLGYWLLVMSTLAVLFLVNPSLVLLPALLFAISVMQLWISNNFADWNRVMFRALLAAPIFLVVLSDPAYFQQFVLGKLPHLPPYNSPAAPLSPEVQGVTERILGYLNGPLWADMRNIIPLALIKLEHLITLSFLLHRAGKYFRRDLYWQPRLHWLKFHLVSLFLLLFVLVILLRTMVPQNNATSLLANYLQRNSAQLAQIFAVLIIVSTIIAAPWAQRLGPKTLILLLILGLPIGIVIPDRLYDTDLRRNFRNEIPVDDKEIFAYSERMHNSFAKTTGLDPYFAPSTPRILILNEARQINNENWLFPIGAGNILPMQERTLPCAFYYFQGSEDYSYENYLKHVSEKLDLPWLRARNIAYVYVPSEMPDEHRPQWLREYTSRPENIEAQSGRALLLRL